MISPIVAGNAPTKFDPPTWRSISPESLPIPGQPVLLLLKDRREVPLTKKPNYYGEKTEDPPKPTALLQRGSAYSYVVAVLQYIEDGFKTLHPYAFRSYILEKDVPKLVDGVPNRDVGVTFGASYELAEVDAWLPL